MMKLFLLVCISILFLGCDDETQPSGGGQARIILNCSPATGIEMIQLITAGGPLYMPGSTDLFTVTKGQSLVCHATIVYNPCKPIEIKFELNGTVIDTRNFNMGGNDNITCPDGNSKSCTFIVP